MIEVANVADRFKKKQKTETF